MKKEEIELLRDKIIKGLHLAFKKLVVSKAKEDGELIFSENGKIIKIKAKDIKLK